MLLSKEVEIVLQSKNIKYYEELGYEIPRYYNEKKKKNLIIKNSKLMVKVDELLKTSHVKVSVRCDYCGEEFYTNYSCYNRGRKNIDKDCCKSNKCQSLKIKDVSISKYGVSHYLKNKDENIKFNNNKKPTIDSIKSELMEHGYFYEGEIYNNSKETITVMDDCGYKYESTLTKIRIKEYPARYGYDNKYTFYNIKKYLIDNDIALTLSDDNKLTNYGDKLLFIDEHGYKIYTPWRKVIYKTYYNPFNISNPYTIENIKLWLKINNYDYELISDTYKGYDKKLVFKCPIHGEFKIDLSHLFSIKENRGCQKCSLDRISGENNYNYNPNLSDKERVLKRSILGENIVRWSKDVLKRDDYTCQHCGVRGVYLQAHHINGYNWCVDRRCDIENGVSLCKKCHSEFHKKYGYGNNTENQYKEFDENKIYLLRKEVS